MTERDGNGERVSADPLDLWGTFVHSVRERLEAGRRAYGDASFTRPPDELLGELQQEALDLAGWGFVLWQRIEGARQKATGMEAGATERASRPTDGPKGRPARPAPPDASNGQQGAAGPSAGSPPDSSDGRTSFFTAAEWTLPEAVAAAVDGIARATGFTPGELLAAGVQLVADQLAREQARQRSRIILPGGSR